VKRWDYCPSLEEIDLSTSQSLPEVIAAVYAAYAGHFGKRIYGDKTPSYIVDLHVLNAMFPAAKFIHLIRDGRDVALSVIRQFWGPNDLISALRQWSCQVSCARKMLCMLPEERWLELRFEDLVAHPEAELRRITTLLGIEFEPAMISGYRDKAEHKVGDRINRHHTHLSKSPSESQAYKWRQTLSSADQAIAEEIAGPLLAELGYPPGVRRHPLKIPRQLYHRLREAYAWRIGNRHSR
jgi:hypothetical protein